MPRAPRNDQRTRDAGPEGLAAYQSQHAALSAVFTHVFNNLGVSAGIAVENEWYALHLAENVVELEIDWGVASRRWRYNERCIKRAMKERRVVVGEQGGFIDFFAPVGGDRPWGTFVVGPVLRKRSTAAEVQERWRVMTSGKAKLTDPRCAIYVARTLATLTLEGEFFTDFGRFVEVFAELAGGCGSAKALAEEASALRTRLEQARHTERMWNQARRMLDERTFRSWLEVASAMELRILGLERIPDQVVVGLLLGRGAELDPIDERVLCDAFQRACTDVARRTGGVICGRIGEHGVAFLVEGKGAPARQAARLRDLGERARELAQRSGLELYVGVSTPGSTAPLPMLYQAARSAAERALSEGKTSIQTEAEQRRPGRPLAELRRRLSQSVGERPGSLSTSFGQYLDAVAIHSGFRLEPARAHLEAGLERVIETLAATGLVDDKSQDDLWRGLDTAGRDANTVRELLDAYRRIVSDLEGALLKPTRTRHNLGATRAREYIREHLNEPLTLARVSRVAGFAPDYFSKLLKREEGVGFEEYTRKLRIDRACEMLSGTALSVERIAKLCGFRTRNYFHEAFKQATRETPRHYRVKVRVERAKEVLGLTSHDLETVAQRCRFESVADMRRAFQKNVGVSPEEYRHSQKRKKSRK